ncbi:EGR1 [Mytilus coruscus]|uniref:EGR1 n=1 Tax=Mytilus coruscus TaxID=42192 RepID=A0A6J8DHX9_MYTCO|nr:EGR1 [Mytilus coruscus]
MDATLPMPPPDLLFAKYVVNQAPIQMMRIAKLVSATPASPGNYACPVKPCDGRKFSRFPQYMRHWMTFHTPTTSILPCQSCIHFSESRMEIRDHLVKTHKYKSLAARRTAEGMTRRNIINSKYKSPGPNIPPAREPQIHIQEEIVRLVENIPRDSD